MNEYQGRVIAEKKELDEKLNKLRLFFNTDTFKNLNPVEQARMHLQEMLMGAYSDVLYRRIVAFQGVTTNENR